jgi:hydroxyacylglutathione hydrolase
MAELAIHTFPALRDNYCYLIHDETSNVTGVIDTPEVAAIERALETTGWRLTHILNTHHHPDHDGGNLELKKKTGCTVVGARTDEERIHGIDVAVGNGETYAFGSHGAQILEVPGHTKGDIAYWFKDSAIVFVGDALFALGCGRLFEGTPQQMWASLQKLMALPDDTKVYCAHEYTQKNAHFALTVEPQNEDLVARAQEIDRLREDNTPTTPTTIGLEKSTNPFLRPMSAELQATLGLQGAALVDVFAETRRRRNKF